jgi:hypothetical protein
MGFYILPTADDKEELTYQKKIRTNTHKRRGKYLSRSGAYLVLDSGAYIIREE